MSKSPDANDRLRRDGWHGVDDMLRGAKPIHPPENGTAKPPAKEGPKIVVADALDLVANPPPAPISLVDVPGLVDAGELTLVSGDPGSCKSLLAVNFAAAVASGREFGCLRKEPRDPLPVLLCLAEYSRYRASQRLAAVIQHYGIQRGMLRVWTRQDPPGFLNLTARSSELALELADLVRKEGVGLVVLDSLSEVHDQDENDRRAMVSLVQDLRLIADAGCAVVPIHHNRKAPAGGKGRGGDPSLADVRGSTALPAGLATALACRRENADEDGSLSAISVWTKHNYSRPDPRAFRFTLDNPATGVITSVEPVELGGRPAHSDQEILDAMKALGGKDLKVQAIVQETGIGEKTVRVRLAAMADEGKIPRPTAGDRGAKLWSVRDEDGGHAEEESGAEA